jgi:hypothetical protein
VANVEHDTRERLLREVGETLQSLEATIRRARRALAAVGDEEPNIRLALEHTIGRLDEARRELQQGAYFGGSQQRLV